MVIDDDGIYSLALGILYILRDSKPYGDLSQLSLLLDKPNFDKLIDHFGGKKIYVPTRDELNMALKALALVQLSGSFSGDYDRIAKSLDVSQKEADMIRTHVKAIRYYLGNLNEDILVGGHKRDDISKRWTMHLSGEGEGGN